jgi:hypothetical protein
MLETISQLGHVRRRITLALSLRSAAVLVAERRSLVTIGDI